MRMLGTATHTWRRFAAGSAGTDGRFVEGSITTSTLRGSLQPATGDDLQTLPEGDRTKRVRVLYTATALRTVSQADRTSADQVTVDGDWFEVREVQPYGTTALAHTRAILVAVQEAE